MLFSCGPNKGLLVPDSVVDLIKVCWYLIHVEFAFLTVFDVSTCTNILYIILAWMTKVTCKTITVRE